MVHTCHYAFAQTHRYFVHHVRKLLFKSVILADSLYSMFYLCFAHRSQPTFMGYSSKASLIFRVFAVLFWPVWFIWC